MRLIHYSFKIQVKKLFVFFIYYNILLLISKANYIKVCAALSLDNTNYFILYYYKLQLVYTAQIVNLNGLIKLNTFYYTLIIKGGIVPPLSIAV